MARTQADYAAAVERNLAGLEFVSVGACPGCDECREAAGYVPHERDDTDGNPYWAIDAVRPSRNGRPEGIVTAYDTEEECEAACREAFDEDLRAGLVNVPGDEFSRCECGICGSRLAGSREVWHYVADGKVQHADDACVDCVLYLANGDLPEVL